MIDKLNEKIKKLETEYASTQQNVKQFKEMLQNNMNKLVEIQGALKELHHFKNELNNNEDK